MIAGLIGLFSGLRKSYTMVYSFYSASLVSMFLVIFLIVYYSILIHYYRIYTSNLVPNAQLFTPSNRPDSGDQSYGIVGTNLALSIFTLIIAFAATMSAMAAGKICIRQKTYSDYFGNPRITNPTFNPNT